jgi:hypothetical protein
MLALRLPLSTLLPLTSFSLCSVGMESSPTTAWSIPTSKPSLSPVSADASAAGCTSSWLPAAGGGDCGGEDGFLVRIWTGDESSAKKRRFLAGLSSGCGDSIVWRWCCWCSGEWLLLDVGVGRGTRPNGAPTRFHGIDMIASCTPAAARRTLRGVSALPTLSTGASSNIPHIVLADPASFLGRTAPTFAMALSVAP